MTALVLATLGAAALAAVAYALVARAHSRAIRAEAEEKIGAANQATRDAERDLADERRAHDATRAALAAESRRLTVSEAQVRRLQDQIRARETGAEAWDREAGRE